MVITVSKRNDETVNRRERKIGKAEKITIHTECSMTDSPVGEHTGADPEDIVERIVIGMTVILSKLHKTII